jgi:aminobenzoyl-glutamate utilization protein B
MCIFTHVSSNLGVSWGQARGTGLISVEYTFEGEAAHSAGAPWRGRSALDAAELMNVGWNYKREHLHPLKRSHSIFTDSGDQPNVVPSKSSIWFYLRDVTYEGIMDMYKIADDMADASAGPTTPPEELDAEAENKEAENKAKGKKTKTLAKKMKDSAEGEEEIEIEIEEAAKNEHHNGEFDDPANTDPKDAPKAGKYDYPGSRQ